MKIADAKNSGAIAAAPVKRIRRRTYPRQFKREVVAQCLLPGASVSAIALSHGINANVIRKWLPQRASGMARVTATMLPVTIDSALPAPTRRLRAAAVPAGSRAPIELSLAGATVRLPPGFDAQELRSIVQILAALG
ncbi:MAG: transposase [Ramlibacter sp.]|nr:transposase [Ramlibacter sp.]